MRFLALGDSYTIGEGVATEERWPKQLARLLGERGQAVEAPVIIATTGWTTDELAAGIRQAGPRGPYDLVSLLIGVNNQYRGRDLDEYRREFAGLLRQAIDFAGGDSGRVLVLSIPDWGVTPFAAGRSREAVSEEIDRFNRANAEEAARLGAHYVDVTPVSRQAGAQPELLAADGLHPSGQMYALWARLALPAALEALKAKT
jgi:lysophospholipase L1-like esterase